MKIHLGLSKVRSRTDPYTDRTGYQTYMYMYKYFARVDLLVYVFQTFKSFKYERAWFCAENVEDVLITNSWLF